MEESKEFRYLSKNESMHNVISDVDQILDTYNISKEERRPFLLAISEAVTNAILHGNQKNPEKSVFLRVTINEKVMSADILDEGQGGLDKIRQRQPSAPSDEGGRGIDLIEHYATSVGYVETPTGGLKVEIKFAREGNSVVDK